MITAAGIATITLVTASCLLMAQSGGSLRRINLVAFGAKQTLDEAALTENGFVSTLTSTELCELLHIGFCWYLIPFPPSSPERGGGVDARRAHQRVSKAQFGRSKSGSSLALG